MSGAGGAPRAQAVRRTRQRLRQRRYPAEFRIPAGYPAELLSRLERRSAPNRTWPGTGGEPAAPPSGPAGRARPADTANTVDAAGTAGSADSAGTAATADAAGPPRAVGRSRRAGQAQAPEPRRGPREPGGSWDHASDAALADLATQLWRLGRKLADGRGAEPAGRLRRTTRHLVAAQDALARTGVSAQDHDGMEFDIGLALDVLAYQPTPGATRETVQETVRPSVYRDGRCIQLGQVIVATPEGDEDHGSRDR